MKKFCSARGILFATAMASGLGCVGSIDGMDGKSPGDPSGNGGGSQPGNNGGGNTATNNGGNAPAPNNASPAAGQIRRLSTAQFRRSLQDLLGGIPTLPTIEDSPASDGLRAIGLATTSLSNKGVEQYEAAVKAAVDPLFADTKRRDAFVGCAPAAWDATCAKTFLEGFGKRAWRRPLDATELDRYMKLGQAEAMDGGSFAAGASAMTQAILQSPYFLYRIDLGGKAVTGKTWLRYSGYEVASRLSFLLWSTTPDQALLTAAQNGALDTPDGIKKEMQRLIDSPRVADGLTDMIDDMFALDAVYLMAKDAKIFPQLTPTLRDAMRSEVIKLFSDAALKKDSDLLQLFNTDSTFANEELGKLYGIKVTGTELIETKHPANIPRAGLLTAAALMTVQDKAHETSPTRRGAYIRDYFMCQHIPDPPAGVDVNIKEPPPGVILSRRALLAQHATDISCSGCHLMMDGIGLALENFDAIGIYRTKETNGLNIDASGEVDGTKFSGPKELGAIFAKHTGVRDCMARRLYRYATGRHEHVADYDDYSIGQLANAFASGGNRFKGMLTSLVTSDGFLNVSAAKK